MMTSFLCLALTLGVFRYLSRAENPYTISGKDISQLVEQRERLRLDEALHEISEEEATAQRKAIETSNQS